MNKIKLICFDICGTLVNGNSWRILTEGIGCSYPEHRNIFLRCQKGEITFTEGERMMTRIFRNSGDAREKLINDIFNNIKVINDGKDLISYLKRKGYLIYLISGSLDIYVESVAKKVGADGFYANSSLEFDDKGIIKKIIYRENEGKVKLEQLKDLIKKLGITMDQVVFIGDSDNDVEVFEATKHGIAINGSINGLCKELNKVAWREFDSAMNNLIDEKLND